MSAFTQSSTALLRATLSCCVMCACTGKQPDRSSEDAIPERKGVIVRRGSPLTLVGPELEVGDDAPAFELAGTEASAQGTSAQNVLRSSDLRGKVVVVSVVPSIDTPVCEAQTDELSQLQPAWPRGTVLVTVSRDLPFAQKRFLKEHPGRSKMASDFRDASFGKAWGVFVKETGLLARSVWIIDRDGRIAYREIVRDQTQEPNYRALGEALKRLTPS